MLKIDREHKSIICIMYLQISITFFNFSPGVWGGGRGPMNRCVCRRLGVRGIISETVGHQISGRHISGRFSLRPVLFGNIYVVCVIIYPEFRIPDPDGLPLLQNFLSQWTLKCRLYPALYNRKITLDPYE